MIARALKKINWLNFGNREDKPGQGKLKVNRISSLQNSSSVIKQEIRYRDDGLS